MQTHEKIADLMAAWARDVMSDPFIMKNPPEQAVATQVLSAMSRLLTSAATHPAAAPAPRPAPAPTPVAPAPRPAPAPTPVAPAPAPKAAAPEKPKPKRKQLYTKCNPTPELIAKAKALYEAGLNTKKVARAMGLNPYHTKKLLDVSGVTFRKYTIVRKG